MPETGFRATVAMAFAATEVKKKEKSSVRPRPTSTTVNDVWRLEKKSPAASDVTSTPTSIVTRDM